MSPTAADFSIEPGAESTLPKCECCGGVTRIVRMKPKAKTGAERNTVT